MGANPTESMWWWYRKDASDLSSTCLIRHFVRRIHFGQARCSTHVRNRKLVLQDQVKGPPRERQGRPGQCYKE